MTSAAVGPRREGTPISGGSAAALAFLVVAAGILVLGQTGRAPSACPPLLSGDALATTPVHHVYFLIKENHAFENYFGARPGVLGYPPNGSFPVAYGSSETISPFPLAGTSTPDLPHDTPAERADLGGGKLNNFVAQAAASGAAAPADAVGYYTRAAIPTYYAYADHYGLADRFFAGVLGPTLPNRVFDLAGTSGNWTTDAVPPPSVFRFPTIFDQLASRGVSFAYDYSGSPAELPPFDIPSVSGNLCEVARVVPVTELRAQLAAGAGAPAVTFIDPSHAPLVSEHPSGNVSLGSEWSATVVNTILGSAVGSSSVIFLLFDEGGGFWDPVLPPTLDATGDGFRVPLLVISPWTPSGLVVDAPLDPAALLRFIDDNWGMAPLNSRVAAAPALDAFFAFRAPRTAPLFLPTNVSLEAGSGGYGAAEAGGVGLSPSAALAPGNPGSLYLARWSSGLACRAAGSPSITR